MVSMLTSSAVDCGSEPRSGQTRGYEKNGDDLSAFIIISS